MTDAATPLLSHRQILTIIAGLVVGMFLAALDMNIVATSIRVIADDLNGLTLQAWATTAYLVTSTLTTPLYGKLSDLYGRRPVFLFAIGLFLAGSLTCAFAGSMYQLAVFRAIQGLGGGGLFSLALTILSDIVAPRDRPRYQGYFTAMFAASSVLGPLAGGLLAGQESILGIAGWRWVFLVNLPIGLVALVIVARVLNIPHTRRSRRVDWPGALALALGLVPLLVVAEQGRQWGWGSAASVGCFGIGAVGLVLFVLNERRYGEHALLPLEFFRNRTFGLGTAASMVIGVAMFGSTAALPLYLQIAKGASPTEAGLLTLPMVFGLICMSLTAGRIISRTGRLHRWPLLGVTLMIAGLGLLAAVDAHTSFRWVAVFMALFGMGLGASTQPIGLAVQSAMPVTSLGVATSSVTFFRQVGGTLGTAVFLSILFGTVSGKITEAFRATAGSPDLAAALADPSVRADPVDRPILDAVASGTPGSVSLDDTSFLNHLDPRLAQPFLDGFAASMSLTFATGAAVLVLAWTLVLLMPEVPLRAKSALELRRDAEHPHPADSVP
ncbi:MDR family MFS transporter [Pseudonocardia eucalypti]|uniref:MDR family MFS transporter n=1 Tax=Pseudonocardia eucalypti TaxID=648755 RepID=A0ABP9QZR5_9PSEU|nr:EmrB/QacA subfamily drug resistance transporter [Pseudonocardia eucalypti]